MVASRLFCADTVLIDVVLTVSSLPHRAGDVRATSQLITTGGGFNAMSAAARHEVDVVYAGRLGSGPFATLASADLARERIGAPVETNSEVDCGICVVLVEPDAERTFITTAGAESTLRGSDLSALDIEAGDYVLVSGYNVMYDDMAEVVLSWLESLDSEVIVAFDPATRVDDIPPKYLARVLPRANWILSNLAEAAALGGTDDAKAAATALTQRGESLSALVRCGAAGCVVVEHGAPAVVVEGFSTAVVDTNGAGDVHNGVFLAELAHQIAPIAAARWANAAAAMAVALRGPATGPHRGEVAEFLATRAAAETT
ncbi:MAG: PfkB family carbohydrate kinase [Acidimicrobiales bacterium]